jgi:hypothetical protein
MKQSKIQRYLIDDPQKTYPYPILLYWLDSNPQYDCNNPREKPDSRIHRPKKHLLTILE